MGKTRTREVTLSMLTIAPCSSAAARIRRTRTTSLPMASGSTSCVRTWITLGPAASVTARSAEKSRS